jgi:signal transduction histidine kinase
MPSQSRTVLLAGFGGLLLIMAFAGFDGFRLVRRMANRSAAIQRLFRERGRVLNQIRSDVYLSGTWARDYLLEPQPAKADRDRAELSRLRREMDAVLGNYAATPPVESLRHSLEDYWRVLDPVFRWSPAERRERGFSFMQAEILPRRAAMLALADQIQAVNEQQMDSANNLLSELFADFRNRLEATLTIALILGVLLAAFVSRRILHLESQAAVRYAEVLETRAQLKNLSANLVETQEKERRALSRELHDEVGQQLSAMLVGLSNLAASVKAGASEQTEEEVTGLRRIAETTVRSIRNISLLLRPSMLDDLGLVPALEWQAREASRQSGLRVDIAAEGIPGDLPEEVRTCVYRVVQEALRNATRHADATSVRIAARQDEGRLVLSVQDDGSGFDATRTRGLGLLGMEERIAHLGGTLQVRTGPGQGTLISAVLPL